MRIPIGLDILPTTALGELLPTGSGDGGGRQKGMLPDHLGRPVDRTHRSQAQLRPEPLGAK